MSLVKFKVLQGYIDDYSSFEDNLYDLTKSQLFELRTKLDHAFANATTWFNILKSGRRKILPDSQKLIFDTYRILEAAHQAVLREIVLVEISDEAAKEWEHELYPQQRENEADYNYGLLSPLDCDDFSAEIDETWYPTPIGGLS